jgi:replicative DNA helicase
VRQFGCRWTRRDHDVERPSKYANIYALLGAESGTGKSVVRDDLCNPILDAQTEILDKFLKEETPELEAERKLLEREIQDIMKEKAPDLAEDTRQLRLTDLFKRQAELDDKLESACRLVASDFTSEALGKLLASSGEQMAVLSDEGGIALYNMMGRYTKGDMTDDIFLSMCKTVSHHIVDRATRPPIVLKAPCVTLLLMVQPDLLNKAFTDERLLIGGFLARCFFSSVPVR